MSYFSNYLLSNAYLSRSISNASTGPILGPFHINLLFDYSRKVDPQLFLTQPLRANFFIVSLANNFVLVAQDF